MNRILQILFSLLVLSNYVMAQGVNYYQGDIYDALQSAKRQNKILLVECYADWNYKSKWMNNMINNSKKVCDYLSSQAVVWKIDTSTPGGAKFAVDYMVTDYPAIFIFNKSGVVIDKIEKALDPDDFINTIEDDIFTLDGGNLWKIEQLEKYANAGDKEGADKIFCEYLQALGSENLLKKSNRWIFKNKIITYYYSTAFDFLLEQRKEMSKNPEDSIFVSGIIHDVMHDYLLEALLSSSIKDTVTLERIAKFTSVNLSKDDPCLLFRNVIYAEIIEDYDLYVKNLDVLISSLPEEDGPKLACTLYNVAEHGTNSQKAKARAIVRHQMNLSPNPSVLSSLEILYNSL